MPTGVAIGMIALLLVWDSSLAGRDKLPWRLMMVAGLTMPIADAFWLAADPPLAAISGDVAAVVNMVPLILLAAAVLLFRPALKATRRPRSQYYLDLIGTVIVAGLTLWYVVRETVPASSGADLTGWLVCGAAALLAIAILARIGLRPTEGLSPVAATVLVLGGSAAIVGAVTTNGPGPVTDGAAAIGQIAFAVFRCALIVGGQLELRARDKHQDLIREHGPSPLFYAAIALGSIQLGLLVIDLGTRYLVVAASCVALSAIIAVRQFFTVRDAVQADKARHKTEARFGWLVRNSSDFIMAVDAEGTIDYVSPSVERLLRSPAQQLLVTAHPGPPQPRRYGRAVHRSRQLQDDQRQPGPCGRRSCPGGDRPPRPIEPAKRGHGRPPGRRRVCCGGEPFVMNVNLSSRQLVRDIIADEVAAAVDE